MRLLLVEDEERVASFIAKGLADAGYVTDIAGSAGEARQRLVQSGPYSLILLDIGLPDADGFTLLSEIRRADQETPIIVLTARGDVPSRVRGLDLGADDYLPKPFDFEELLARI
ncbi:MAG: response regulator, partial [Thermoleophilia bacterium]|nr:response regulator [Thermoleophilia bacterium]